MDPITGGTLTLSAVDAVIAKIAAASDTGSPDSAKQPAMVGGQGSGGRSEAVELATRAAALLQKITLHAQEEEDDEQESLLRESRDNELLESLEDAPPASSSSSAPPAVDVFSELTPEELEITQKLQRAPPLAPAPPEREAEEHRRAARIGARAAEHQRASARSAQSATLLNEARQSIAARDASALAASEAAGERPSLSSELDRRRQLEAQAHRRAAGDLREREREAQRQSAAAERRRVEEQLLRERAGESSNAAEAAADAKRTRQAEGALNRDMVSSTRAREAAAARAEVRKTQQDTEELRTRQLDAADPSAADRKREIAAARERKGREDARKRDLAAARAAMLNDSGSQRPVASLTNPFQGMLQPSSSAGDDAAAAPVLPPPPPPQQQPLGAAHASLSAEAASLPPLATRPPAAAATAAAAAAATTTPRSPLSPLGAVEPKTPSEAVAVMAATLDIVEHAALEAERIQAEASAAEADAIAAAVASIAADVLFGIPPGSEPPSEEAAAASVAVTAAAHIAAEAAADQAAVVAAAKEAAAEEERLHQSSGVALSEMGLGLLAKATAASSASSPSRGSTGGDTSTPRSATAPQQQQQPQQLHFTKSATALPRTPKASESTAADAAAAAQQPPQPPHSHPQIHLRIPEIEVSLGIPKAVFSAAMAPVNFVGNLFRRGGNAKATRTAQPFNAPASAVTPRSRDPRAFVTAIESRDGPPLHAGDSAAETLLEAPPPPPLGLEEAAALAEAAAALAKMDKPSRDAMLSVMDPAKRETLLNTVLDRLAATQSAQPVTGGTVKGAAERIAPAAAAAAAAVPAAAPAPPLAASSLPARPSPLGLRSSSSDDLKGKDDVSLQPLSASAASAAAVAAAEGSGESPAAAAAPDGFGRAASAPAGPGAKHLWGPNRTHSPDRRDAGAAGPGSPRSGGGGGTSPFPRSSSPLRAGSPFRRASSPYHSRFHRETSPSPGGHGRSHSRSPSPSLSPSPPRRPVDLLAVPEGEADPLAWPQSTIPQGDLQLTNALTRTGLVRVNEDPPEEERAPQDLTLDEIESRRMTRRLSLRAVPEAVEEARLAEEMEGAAAASEANGNGNGNGSASGGGADAPFESILAHMLRPESRGSSFGGGASGGRRTSDDGGAGTAAAVASASAALQAAAEEYAHADPVTDPSALPPPPPPVSTAAATAASSSAAPASDPGSPPQPGSARAPASALQNRPWLGSEWEDRVGAVQLARRKKDQESARHRALINKTLVTAAAAVEGMDPPKRLEALEALGAQQAAALLVRMSPLAQRKITAELSHARLIQLAAAVEPGLRGAFLVEIPPAAAAEALGCLPWLTRGEALAECAPEAASLIIQSADPSARIGMLSALVAISDPIPGGAAAPPPDPAELALRMELLSRLEEAHPEDVCAARADYGKRVRSAPAPAAAAQGGTPRAGDSAAPAATAAGTAGGSGSAAGDDDGGAGGAGGDGGSDSEDEDRIMEQWHQTNYGVWEKRFVTLRALREEEAAAAAAWEAEQQRLVSAAAAAAGLPLEGERPEDSDRFDWSGDEDEQDEEVNRLFRRQQQGQAHALGGAARAQWGSAGGVAEAAEAAAAAVASAAADAAAAAAGGDGGASSAPQPPPAPPVSTGRAEHDALLLPKIDPELRAVFLHRMGPARAAAVLELVPAALAAECLSALELAAATAIWELLPKAQRARALLLLRPPECAGAVLAAAKPEARRAALLGLEEAQAASLLETRAPLVTELLSAATATFKRRDEAEKKRQQFREAMAAKGALHPLQRVAWTGFEAESEELWAGSKEDIADAERARRVVAVARLQLAAQGGGDADDDDGFGGAGDAEEEEAPPPPPPAADAPAKSIESDYAADRSAQLAGAKRAQESAAAAAAEAAAARARKAEIRPDIEALRARVAQQAQQADANVHVHRRRMAEEDQKQRQLHASAMVAAARAILSADTPVQLKMVSVMDPQQAVEMLKHLKPEEREQLVAKCPPETVRAWREAGGGLV